MAGHKATASQLQGGASVFSCIKGWEVTIAPEDGIRGAGRGGLRASLHPRRSFLNRFAEVACMSWMLPGAELASRARAWS